MQALSPAHRARRVFMRLSLLVSGLVFFILGGNVLIEQWIIGQASAEFILGTAVLIAGISVGLFAFIAALGLAISIALGEEPASGGAGNDVPATQRPYLWAVLTRTGRLGARQPPASTLAGIDTGKQVQT